MPSKPPYIVFTQPLPTKGHYKIYSVATGENLGIIKGSNEKKYWEAFDIEGNFLKSSERKKQLMDFFRDMDKKSRMGEGGGIENVNKWEKGDVTIVNGENLKRAEVVPSYKDDTMRGNYFVIFRDENKKIIESKDNFEAYNDALRYAMENVNKYATGGGIGFEKLSNKVAKNYEGKKVAPKYQHEYGKTYSRAEAKEVGDKVAGKVYWQQQGRMAKGGSIKKYDYSPSIEEQKTWDEKKTRIYDAYANSKNKYKDLLNERKQAIGRNDKDEVKSIDRRLKNSLYTIKWAYSELTGITDEEEFKDGGNLGSLDARISKAIFQAYGDIDDAIEFKFNDPDSGVAPYRLVFLAVQKGFITPEEINKAVLNSAYETSSETADAEEIGSSDMNFYVWSMLRDAGFDMQFENGTYVRVRNKMAEGGNLGLDVQETIQKIRSEYPRVEVSKTYGGSIQVVDTSVSTLQEINSKVFSGKGSIMKIGGKFSFAHGLYYPPMYKSGGGIDDYVQKSRESQAKEEKGKYFSPYRAFVYEDSYQFADFKTDDFHKAVKWAKEMLESQRAYRKNTENMWAIVDEFTPIEERTNVIYPYKEVARFTEGNTKEMKFGNGGNTTFYHDQAKKTLGEHLYNHIASLNKEQLEKHLSHLQKEIERMKAEDTEFTKQEFLPKYKQEEKFILYLLERLDEFKYADGGNVEEDKSYNRTFRNNAGKDVTVKIIKNPIFGKYDYWVDGSVRGQFDTYEEARAEVNYENFDMYKDGGNIYSKEESLQIARTILQQMGGQNRLVAFTGAYGFAYADGDVSFRIKNRKVNYVKVKLNGKDLYDVTFGRVSGTNFKVVEQLDDVYAEDLIDIFEKSTGMYLRFDKGGKMAKGGGIGEISEKDFINKKSFQIGDTLIELEKLEKPTYYRANYTSISDNEKIGSYGSPIIEDVIYDIKSVRNKYKKGGGIEEEDFMSQARTSARESIDWEEELRNYAGDNYKSLTAKEKEEIIAELKENYDYHYSYAKGGLVVTSIKDIPNFKEELDAGRITYRGLGMGKLSKDFYKIAGEGGTRIKVKGKEYYITDSEFDTFSRDSSGKMRIKFDAPHRRFAKGGNTDLKYSVTKKPDESGLYYIVYSDSGTKVPNSKLPKNIGYGSIKNEFEAKRKKYDASLGLQDAVFIVKKMNEAEGKMAKGGEIFNSEFYKDGGSIDINFAKDTNYIKRENIKLVKYKNGKELYNWDYWDSYNVPAEKDELFSGIYVAHRPLPEKDADKQYSMFKKGGNLTKTEKDKLPKSAFYIKRSDIDSVIIYDEIKGEEVEIPANRIVNGIWFDNHRTQMIIDRAKKEGLIPDKTKKTTTFIARFNGKKIELEAKSMFDAQQKALKEFKVPKSKRGLLSVMSKQAYERGDFQFN